MRNLEERIFCNVKEELEKKVIRSEWTGTRSQNIAADNYISSIVKKYMEK